MTDRKIVIAGAGQAAASFAAKLRELDRTCAITLIGDEPVLPYQRPPLSKKYMTGDMDAERLLLRPADWYETNHITCMRGVRVEEIDRAAKKVMLSSGDRLNYDKLLIATGSTPRHLPEEAGGKLDGVFVLRSLADADAMAHRFAPGKRVLIVGGGYIGLEAAAVAAQLGLEVHVAEMAERILQRVASPQTSDWYRELHRSHGVNIMENTSLKCLTGTDGHVSGAQFKDGTSLEIDFALVGIGVVPAMELAVAAGLETANGICVDSACRTSDPDILSAGDCASFEFGGNRIRLESVQNAIDQAEAAAHTAAGVPADYKPTPWFWSDQYDAKLQIAGLNAGYDETCVRPGVREGSQSIWYFRSGKFLAVDAINDSRSYMFGKKLLELGRNVTPAQASDPAFDLKQLIQ
ncbi:MAG: FAD-dependent oxidoreductase [Rhizobiaceae bacterium]